MQPLHLTPRSTAQNIITTPLRCVGRFASGRCGSVVSILIKIICSRGLMGKDYYEVCLGSTWTERWKICDSSAIATWYLQPDQHDHMIKESCGCHGISRNITRLAGLSKLLKTGRNYFQRRMNTPRLELPDLRGKERLASAAGKRLMVSKQFEHVLRLWQGHLSLPNSTVLQQGNHIWRRGGAGGGVRDGTNVLIICQPCQSSSPAFSF